MMGPGQSLLLIRSGGLYLWPHSKPLTLVSTTLQAHSILDLSTPGTLDMLPFTYNFPPESLPSENTVPQSLGKAHTVVPAPQQVFLCDQLTMHKSGYLPHLSSTQS